MSSPVGVGTGAYVLIFGQPPSHRQKCVKRVGLPHGPDGLSRAREELEACLTEWGREELVPAALQCVTEVVAEIDRDEDSELELEVAAQEDCVVTTLRRFGEVDTAALARADVDRARRLAVLEGGSSLWGMHAGSDVEALWFELS